MEPSAFVMQRLALVRGSFFARTERPEILHRYWSHLPVHFDYYPTHCNIERITFTDLFPTSCCILRTLFVPNA